MVHTHHDPTLSPTRFRPIAWTTYTSHRPFLLRTIAWPVEPEEVEAQFLPADEPDEPEWTFEGRHGVYGIGFRDDAWQLSGAPTSASDPRSHGIARLRADRAFDDESRAFERWLARRVEPRTPEGRRRGSAVRLPADRFQPISWTTFVEHDPHEYGVIDCRATPAAVRARFGAGVTFDDPRYSDEWTFAGYHGLFGIHQREGRWHVSAAPSTRPREVGGLEELRSITKLRREIPILVRWLDQQVDAGREEPVG